MSTLLLFVVVASYWQMTFETIPFLTPFFSFLKASLTFIVFCVQSATTLITPLLLFLTLYKFCLGIKLFAYRSLSLDSFVVSLFLSVLGCVSSLIYANFTAVIDPDYVSYVETSFIPLAKLYIASFGLLLIFNWLFFMSFFIKLPDDGEHEH